jgi:uncharacterized protein YbaP (TraB family)
MMRYQDVLKINRRAPLVLLAVLLLLAAMSRAGTDAGIDKGHGLLWEVSGEGAEPAYLFGTIHSEAPGVLQLAEPVQQAFEASQAVVLEMLLDVDAMMYSSTAMLMMDGRSLSDIVGQPLFSQISRAIQSRGIPEVVLDRMQPWAAAVTLSMPAPETGQVLDAMLYQNALQQGKQVYGLETVQEQLHVFESMSGADQIALLKDAVENFPDIDAMHAELLAAYKQRDLNGLMAISEASMQQGDQRLADEFQQHLIVDRNHRMAERMQQYLQQGKVFIAVGALHLPGAEGLLNLLEQQGYTIRRLY